MSETGGQDVRIEAVLSQLSHAANLGISPEELLTRAMDGLLQVSRAPAGVACLAGAEGKTLEVVSVRGIRPAAARTLPQAFRLDLERGSERVTRPIRIGTEEFPGLEELHARLSAEGIAGGILLPLASDGRLLGFLIAMFRAGAEPPPVLSDAHLDALQQEISSALQNARMRHGLQSLNLDLLRLLTPTRRTRRRGGSACAMAQGSSDGRPFTVRRGSPRTFGRSRWPATSRGIETEGSWRA